MTAPTAAALLGRLLFLDGGGSQLMLTAGPDKALTATRLVLVGEKADAGHEACKTEAAGATPVTALGQETGLASYRIEYGACPISFEVLEGALLVPPETAACDIDECRVRLAGLWGPPPSEIGPDRVKALDHARGAAEAAMRSNYRALSTATKDRPTVMGFAKEQAQFSSSREETCRDYAEEGRHNLCATTLTQARAVELHAKVEVALAQKAARKAKRGAAGR